MLLTKVECEKITVEKLGEHLVYTVEQGFRVWLYNKKVYATFKISSFPALKKLIENFKANNVKFRFFRIEEV